MNILLTRHGTVSTSTDSDPVLDQQGQWYADSLNAIVAPFQNFVTAVFSDDKPWVVATATPLATALGLPVQTFSDEQLIGMFQLLADDSDDRYALFVLRLESELQPILDLIGGPTLTSDQAYQRFFNYSASGTIAVPSWQLQPFTTGETVSSEAAAAMDRAMAAADARRAGGAR
jgi:hypothetical protein